MTILAVIPGLGRALPYIAAIVAICAAIAVVLPHPSAQSMRLYVLTYRMVNCLALNFGHAGNARPAHAEPGASPAATPP